MTKELERAIALGELLGLPDPPEMPVRAHSYLWTGTVGDPDVIKRDLGTAYIERRRQDHCGDISRVVSVAHGKPKITRVA